MIFAIFAKIAFNSDKMYFPQFSPKTKIPFLPSSRSEREIFIFVNRNSAVMNPHEQSATMRLSNAGREYGILSNARLAGAHARAGRAV